MSCGFGSTHHCTLNCEFVLFVIHQEVDDCERKFEDMEKTLLTTITSMTKKCQLQKQCSKEFLDSLLQVLGEDLEHYNKEVLLLLLVI